MAKLKVRHLLMMGFEQFSDRGYSLTLNEEGLTLLGNNHEDPYYGVVGCDKTGFVLDGVLELSTVADLVDIIAKTMYNNGLSAGISIKENDN
jgi:hypothetical protein